MRGETDAAKIATFMTALAESVRGAGGRIYLVGGGTAVLYGWREATIDLALKVDPEPPGFFEAIAKLKDSIDRNVELASPDDFLPPLPGWRERSVFIARQRQIDFFHYDLYSQALAKIERGHQRDLGDVREILGRNLIDPVELQRFLAAIEPELIRCPAVDPAALRAGVRAALGGSGRALKNP